MHSSSTNNYILSSSLTHHHPSTTQLINPILESDPPRIYTTRQIAMNAELDLSSPKQQDPTPIAFALHAKSTAVSTRYK